MIPGCFDFHGATQQGAITGLQFGVDRVMDHLRLRWCRLRQMPVLDRLIKAWLDQRLVAVLVDQILASDNRHQDGSIPADGYFFPGFRA